MKVLLVGLLCATVTLVTGSSSITAWPQSALSVFRSTVPLTRGFAYSTTQYINSAPVPYSFGVHPQLAYHIPQIISPVSPLRAYYPLNGATYFPTAGAVYYPTTSQIVPQVPIASQPGGTSAPPTYVENTNGNDSTQFSEQSPSSETSESQTAAPEAPTPTPQPAPQFPSGVPALPSFPQIPGFPSFPQFPSESFPSLPQIPTNPPLPQFPSNTPSSFPSADSQDKGLNDEDTVSVESAK